MTALDRVCDAYLDRRVDLDGRDDLDGRGRGAGEFEAMRLRQRMQREPRLASAIGLHRRVEESLQRSMPVPDLSALVGRVEALASRIAAREDEGAIRCVTATAAFLLMCLAMCGSSVIVAEVGPASGIRESGRDWSTSFASAVGMGIYTASAVLARGAQLRRARKRRVFSNASRGPMRGAPLHSADAWNATARARRIGQENPEDSTAKVATTKNATAKVPLAKVATAQDTATNATAAPPPVGSHHAVVRRAAAAGPFGDLRASRRRPARFAATGPHRLAASRRVGCAVRGRCEAAAGAARLRYIGRSSAGSTSETRTAAAGRAPLAA